MSEVLNTAAYWKLILKNFMEITRKNWQTHMSEDIKNWKNGTKNNQYNNNKNNMRKNKKDKEKP